MYRLPYMGHAWLTIHWSEVPDGERKKFALQKVSKKMVATECYRKFNTEAAISEFFEKLCHLIIEQRIKEKFLKSKNLYNMLI